MTSQEQEYADSCFGGTDGDPRRCRRHPSVVTSSCDGMFDAPCGACEYEMETGDEYPAEGKILNPEPMYVPPIDSDCPF